MTLKSIKKVEARVYKSEKWILRESERERVFITKEKAVTDPYKAVDCFIKAIRGKVRL
jgi:hypothetical protein